MTTKTGTLTRTVVFSNGMGRTHRAPAGTEVYVGEHRRYGLVVRIPGSLYTQHVTGETVRPA